VIFHRSPEISCVFLDLFEWLYKPDMAVDALAFSGLQYNDGGTQTFRARDFTTCAELILPVCVNLPCLQDERSQRYRDRDIHLRNLSMNKLAEGILGGTPMREFTMRRVFDFF
jgi:hypothetical protein